MATVTLTTDFGLSDWFVGAMKAVIASRAPESGVIDLTHGIAPGDIRAGAFALASTYSLFPPRSVHLVVVDPGVGGARSALAVRTAAYDFVGPDNGVLSWALRREERVTVRRIENDALCRRPISRTFHGRDVFAPVAAWLGAGGDFSVIGPETAEYVQLPWPEPVRDEAGWRGEVMYVDRFGNAITNLDTRCVEPAAGAEWILALPDGRVAPVADCYAAVAVGECVVVPGSTGYLELAMNRGNAARRLGLSIGARVEVRPVEEHRQRRLAPARGA